MACSSTSAIPWRTKMTPSGPCGPGWGWWRRWANSIPAWTQERGVPLAVRLGIHTGLVVVGDVGGGTRQEQLALGETPNLAARLQGMAAPNTLVISAATFQLLGGFFACQPLGTPLLKGQAQPLAVYRVLYESMARSRLEAGRQYRRGPRWWVGSRNVGLLRSAGRRSRKGSGRWCCSAAKRASASRASFRCCKNTWPPSPRRG